VHSSRPRVGDVVNARDTNLVFVLSSFGNIERGLHPYQRVHFHAEGLFNPQRHVAGEVGPAVQEVGECRPGHAQRHGCPRYRQACGLDDLRPNEISGMRWIFQFLQSFMGEVPYLHLTDLYRVT